MLTFIITYVIGCFVTYGLCISEIYRHWGKLNDPNLSFEWLPIFWNKEYFDTRWQHVINERKRDYISSFFFSLFSWAGLFGVFLSKIDNRDCQYKWYENFYMLTFPKIPTKENFRKYVENKLGM